MRWGLLLLLVARVASADPKLGGYLELYGQWNPNDTTDLRAFDDRADSFALQNAVIEATWTKGPLSGRIAFQAGDAPSIYIHEPSFEHLQEAWAAWQSPYELELAAGLFLSPIGPEVVPTKDNWNWSRSDLFYSLPYYHAGVRAKHVFGDSGWSVIAMICNGWNSAVDNNREPAFDVIAAYAKGPWLAQLQYFGGVERPTGAPEGQPWRHLADAYVQGPIAGPLSFLVHGDAGTEHGVYGASSWAGLAGYLRYDLTPRVYIAARGDYFHEWRPAAASPIFAPTPWITSATATLAWRPVEGLDLRVEYRHDRAARDVYANHLAQDTITAGVIAWF